MTENGQGPPQMPLDDLRVVDLCRYGPGQLAGMVLGDLGADVVRVDEPARSLPANLRTAVHPDGRTARELVTYAPNRNKRSIVADLKLPAGRDIAHALIGQADIVLEGYRPGVAARLGIAYADVVAASPDLIYCSISGFGQTGPYRDRPGHDLNYLALAGLAGRTLDDRGRPVIPGTQLADFAGGTLHALVAILAALRHRERGGGGQYIDASMADGMFTVMTSLFSQYFGGQSDGRTMPDRLTGAAPFYNVYAAADGRWLTLCCNEHALWLQFCEAAGRPDLVAAHGDARLWPGAIAALRAEFARRTSAQWLALLPGLPVFAVLDPADVPDDPHVRARDIFWSGPDGNGTEVRQVAPRLGLTGSPGRIRSLPPRRGEHTTAILAELGYSATAVAALIGDGAVEAPLPDQTDKASR
jgi:alpha-methylacyl-CoA racemase